MDAKANIKSRLSSRHGTAGAVRFGVASLPNDSAVAVASKRSTDAALHLSGDVEIFKKTLCFPGLKPAGRYVAKDMRDFVSIPLLTKTLLDHDTLHGEDIAVTGRTVAENLKGVKQNSHQGVSASAVLDDSAIVQIEAGEGFFNAKLTDKELAAHTTEWKLRATNHTSGAMWNYARQVGPVADGAVAQGGKAHEKRCYADI
jgi:dihydroxyacid dehydratase/phosphogluconate dehydratase